LSKCYHLEVLENPYGCKVDGVSNLVNLRYLDVTMRELPSGSNDGEMRDHEDVQDLRDQHSTRFDITQIQNMNKLVELHLSELEEDDNRAAGYGPILRDKELLESLSLSWKNAKKGLHSETAKNMLEILEPNKAVKKLYIQRYSSDSLPIWFATSAANLQVLSLKGFEELQKLPSLTRLTKLTTGDGEYAENNRSIHSFFT